MNVFNTNKSMLSAHEKAMCCNNAIRQKFTKGFTLEFSRDRKSMSVYVTPKQPNKGDSRLYVKGASEAVIERCTHIKVGQSKIPMTNEIKQEILRLVHQYGTGRDTLRCLALGIVDSPGSPSDYDLEDSRKFINYEQDITFVGVVGMLDPPRTEVNFCIFFSLH